MQLVSADGQFEPYLVNVILVVTLVGGGIRAKFRG
jgi:hypothetical protein